ncbi:CRISPR-associated protein Cas5 [bacterium]|nr:CRISPR-associated protein Cas5 [bacterium]
MECFRVIIESLSAAFFAPGYSNESCSSLPVPPHSAIQGLIAAATGNPEEKGFHAGWMMRYSSIYEDYEKIVPARRKPNLDDFEPFRTGFRLVRTPVKRKYLIEAKLFLYIEEKFIQALQSPCHTLRLGRSQDLAWISSITPVELHQVKEADIEGVILPFPLPNNSLAAFIWAIPEKASGYDERTWHNPKPYAFLRKRQHISVGSELSLYLDSEFNLAIPFYTL